MNPSENERVEKTLRYLEKDKIIPENPWFYSRLSARIEKELTTASASVHTLALVRLKPVFISLVLLAAITGGAFIGKVLSAGRDLPQAEDISIVAETDASAALYKEISGYYNEQMLLMK